MQATAIVLMPKNAHPDETGKRVHRPATVLSRSLILGSFATQKSISSKNCF